MLLEGLYVSKGENIADTASATSVQPEDRQVLDSSTVARIVPEDQSGVQQAWADDWGAWAEGKGLPPPANRGPVKEEA